MHTQKSVPLRYKDIVIDCSYRVDIIVNDCVVVEVKSVERLLPVHASQILTYMRLLECPIGFLINFNVPQLVQGLRRFILEVPRSTESFDIQKRAPEGARSNPDKQHAPTSPGSNPGPDV